MRGEGMRGENMGFVWVLCGFGWVGVDGGSLGDERERAAGGLEPRKMRRFTGVSRLGFFGFFGDDAVVGIDGFAVFGRGGLVRAFGKVLGEFWRKFAPSFRDLDFLEIGDGSTWTAWAIEFCAAFGFFRFAAWLGWATGFGGF